MSQYIGEIKETLHKATGLGTEEIALEVPKNPEYGDYAFPCFILAKRLKKRPDEIAIGLASKMHASGNITEIAAAGPYLNFKVNKSGLAADIIAEILKKKDQFGSNGLGKGKNALIEHTSVNPNASPHVGRARNAMIGDSLARILRFEKYKVEVHYFVNDVGKQIAMLAIGCRDRKNVDFKSLLDIYVQMSGEMEKNPEIEKEIFAMLKKIEEGDKKTKDEFEKVVEICIVGQKKIFSEFGIEYGHFDHESKYLRSKKTAETLGKLEKTGRLFTDEENRKVLDLKGFDIPMENPVLVLTRADGTSLYPLRDLTYHLEKAEKSENNFVVLGEDHKLYYQQIQASMKLLGIEAPKVVHYSFVLLNEGKMSTRKGNIVLLEEFMEEARKKAEQEIRKRHGEVAHIAELSRAIGYGAVKYAILKVSPEKNVNFDWDSALSFEGDTGPYIQYSHARIASILAKHGKKPKSDIDAKLLTKKEEAAIVTKLAAFNETISKACEDLKPHIIAGYASELAQRLNEFYHNCPILQADGKTMEARLALALSVKHALKTCLNLLGIEAPEKM